MSEKPKVVIVLARCCQSAHLYGVRFEEAVRNQWLADWAFAVREQTARRERVDQGDITGGFGFAPEFPGCPHCGARSVFRCSCGKVACWDTETMKVTCPWCRHKGTLGGTVDRLSAGADA